MDISSKGGSHSQQGGFWLVESWRLLIGEGLSWEPGNCRPVGWRAQTTGSHVTGSDWNRKWRHRNRKSRGLEGKTADRSGKRERGLRVQRLKSKSGTGGRSLLERDQTKEDAMLEKWFNWFFPLGVTNGNADPSPEIESQVQTVDRGRPGSKGRRRGPVGRWCSFNSPDNPFHLLWVFLLMSVAFHLLWVPFHFLLMSVPLDECYISFWWVFLLKYECFISFFYGVPFFLLMRVPCPFTARKDGFTELCNWSKYVANLGL